jgi:hypothetical protein
MTRLVAILLVAYCFACDAADRLRGIRMVLPSLASSEMLPPVSDDRLLDWALYVETNRTSGSVYTNLPVVSAFEINRAITNAYAAGTNNIVTLSNQTYELEASIQLLHGVRLRGQGTNTCLREPSTGGAFSLIKPGGGEGYSRFHINIHSGSWKGSTNIALASALSDMMIGSWAVVTATNDLRFQFPYGLEAGVASSNEWTGADQPETPAGHRHRGDVVKLVSISNGTNLVIWPPLTFDYTNTPARWTYVPDHYVQHHRSVGIENMSINVPTNANGIYFEGVHVAWVSNVTFRVFGDLQAAIKVYYTRGLTIQHCGFTGHSSRPSAIDVRTDAAGVLVENNWFSNIEQVHNMSGRGNANLFLGNYVDSVAAGTAELTLHGAHRQFTYYAHNAGLGFWADLIHASASHTTLFRNYLRANDARGSVHFDQWNLTNAMVGNILGRSGLGGFIREKESPTSTATLSLISWNYNGDSNTDDAGGRYAKTTTIDHGNVSFESGSPATNWVSGRSQSLTNCYYYRSRPYYWGTNLTWPPFGPDVSGLTNLIPAQVRYLYGTNSF